MTASAGPLLDSVNRWADVAIRQAWAPEWVDGAILPREMVYFLARCEVNDIDVVIESGRQDGYSTKILGEFIKDKPNMKVFSIDWEDDAERARRCRERLSKYERLSLLKGDANRLFPELLRQNQGRRVALIVDGPKGFWALSLIFASLRFPEVRLVSLHNLSPGTAYREFLEKAIAKPLFYERHGVTSDTFTRLGSEEIPMVDNVRAGRGRDESTLGVIEVDDQVRTFARGAFDRRFKLFQPCLVGLGWQLGADWPVSKLFSLSFRLWRN